MKDVSFIFFYLLDILEVMIGKDWSVLEGIGTTNSMIQLYYFETDVNRIPQVILL
jgi:hypothetical protein